MKKMNRHILAALPGTAVLFAACEALTGPQDEPGKDGINGTTRRSINESKNLCLAV
jgi:hypothetical protein